MKIRFKGRRISGKDAVTFRNPFGEPIMLENIGDVSQDIPADLAHTLCAAYPDIVEVVTEYQAKPLATGENKMAQAVQAKASRKVSDETPLVPPIG